MGVVEGIVVENCGAPLRSHWLCLPCICSLAFIPFSAKLCRSRQHQGEFRFSFEPCRSRSCIRASGTCPLASLSRDMHTGCLISWLGGLASPVFTKSGRKVKPFDFTVRGGSSPQNHLAWYVESGNPSCTNLQAADTCPLPLLAVCCVKTAANSNVVCPAD